MLAAELDPHADALLTAVTEAGHRLVLSRHVGTAEIAGAADEVAPVDEALVETVRRVQADGHGVLVLSAVDGPVLLAADVGVAPTIDGQGPGLGRRPRHPARPDRRVPARGRDDGRPGGEPAAVSSALTGNVLGGLLAAVGSARYGSARRRRPVSRRPPSRCSTARAAGGAGWPASRAAALGAHPVARVRPRRRALAGIADLPEAAAHRRSRLAAPVRAVRAFPVVRVPARFLRTVGAELADPLTPILGTGAAATAILGESTDAILVGSVTVGNALISGLQRLRAETTLESLLLEQDVTAHREHEGDVDGRPRHALRVGDAGRGVGAATWWPRTRGCSRWGDLEVDESNLTGESLPVAKSVAATPGADVADRTCMLFDGTTVVAGRGRRRRRRRRSAPPRPAGRHGPRAARRRRPVSRPGWGS